MCDPISATLIASEFAGSAAAYTAGTAAVGGGLGLGAAGLYGGAELAGGYLGIGLGEGAAAGLGGAAGFGAGSAAGYGGLAGGALGLTDGVGALGSIGDLAGGYGAAAGGDLGYASGQNVPSYMDTPNADWGGMSPSESMGTMPNADGGLTSNLSSSFNSPAATGVTEGPGGLQGLDSAAASAPPPLEGGFTPPDASIGSAPDAATGANGPMNFSPAGDSQAYNASQPFGNNGLGGMFDSAKGAYKSVMNYSPFGSGGPTIGNAKDGMSLVNGLSSLYDAHAKTQIAKQQQNFQQQQMGMVNNYGSIGSPERDLMQQQLERQDAKAGRNSQYGQRAVELNAKLANIRANYGAQTLGTGFNNTTATANNRYGALNSAFFNAGNTPRTS